MVDGSSEVLTAVVTIIGAIIIFVIQRLTEITPDRKFFPLRFYILLTDKFMPRESI